MFHGAAYGAYLMLADMFDRQDRSDQRPASGGALASAGVSSRSTEWSVKKSIDRCRQAVRSASRTYPRRCAHSPSATCRRVRRCRPRRSSPEARTSVAAAANQVAMPCRPSAVG